MRFDSLDRNRQLRVAQYNLETDTLDYVEPTAHIKYSYQGPLVNIETKEQVSIISTPDHELLLRDRKTENWKVVPADQYQHNYQQYHARVGTMMENPYEPSPRIVVRAAVQADGYLVPGGGIELGFTKKRKIERLVWALDALSINYRITNRPKQTRIYIGKAICDMYSLFSMKIYRQELLSTLTEQEKISLFFEIMLWDGNSTRIGRGQSSYMSSIKENVDFVQALAVEAGWRAHYRLYKGKYHCLDLTARPFSLTTNHTMTVLPYDGPVYCVTVPTHNIFVRTNGRVCLLKNCQNIPKKEIRARKPLVAPADHQIVALDYSNLEVWVLAYETEDPVLIEILESGKNVHDENTKTLFGLSPENRYWSVARRAAKIFFFGGIAYGGGDSEIHQKISLEVPELTLTLADYKRAKQNYENVHPAYTIWRDRTLQQVHAHRALTNAFGRTRIFYGNDRDIEKEALNFPIQSGAASVINRATIEIADRLRAAPWLGRLQAQIHDELRFEVPNDHTHELIELAKECMGQNISFYNRTVSFPVDVELGPNWADLQEADL